MRKIVCLFLLMTLFTHESSVLAQTSPANNEVAVTDTVPTYPGGEKAFAKFIKKNLQYPDFCRQFEVEGVCTMVFTVEANGVVSNVHAKNCRITYINPGTISKYDKEKQKAIKKECVRQMAKEGLRVIRKTKKWNPGYKNGHPVRLIHTLELSFTVNYVD